MKVFRLLVMLAFLLVGLVIGALNSQPILIDFAVTSLATTSGIAIIVSMFAGVLLGGCLVLATVVIPMYSKLRQLNKSIAANGKKTVPEAVVVETRPVDGN